jgi:hypothetical protein
MSQLDQPPRISAPCAGALGIVLVALALGGTGCGQGEPEVTSGLPVTATDTVPGTGSVEFSLTAPGGVHFDAFDYVITGPNFARSGSIDVSHSSTVSAVIDRLPVASGYSITVMGSTTVPVATCNGSASFAVSAGAVTQVPLSIGCHLQPDTGPSAVPVPPFAPAALGVALLALGSVMVGRRRAARG